MFLLKSTLVVHILPQNQYVTHKKDLNRHFTDLSTGAVLRYEVSGMPEVINATIFVQI